MALVGLDVPGFLFYSGSASAGSDDGRQVTIKEVWEASARSRPEPSPARSSTSLERERVQDRCLCRPVHREHDGRRERLRACPAGAGGLLAEDPAKPARRRRRAGS